MHDQKHILMSALGVHSITSQCFICIVMLIVHFFLIGCEHSVTNLSIYAVEVAQCCISKNEQNKKFHPIKSRRMLIILPHCIYSNAMFVQKKQVEWE